jgi:DNA-binding XRE family transcriptional regulator
MSESHTEESDIQKCLRCGQLFDATKNDSWSCCYHPVRKPSFKMLVFYEYHGLPRFKRTPETATFLLEHMDDDGPWWHWDCCNGAGKTLSGCKRSVHLAKYRFGEMLRNLRNQNGMGIEELAKKLVLMLKCVEELESGEKKPSFDQIYRIARLFDVPFDSLIDKEIEEEISYADRLKVDDYRRFEKHSKKGKEG